MQRFPSGRLYRSFVRRRDARVELSVPCCCARLPPCGARLLQSRLVGLELRSKATGVDAPDAGRLSHIYQLSGFADPVYAEACVTVHDYDIVLEVRNVLFDDVVRVSDDMGYKRRLFTMTRIWMWRKFDRAGPILRIKMTEWIPVTVMER